MANKNLISGEGVEKMSNVFRVPGEKLLIVGLDTDHKSTDEHWAFDPRIHLPLDEAKTANVKFYGVQKPVKVERIPHEGDYQYIVVDGRQRVRMWREANKQLKKEGEPLLPGVPCVIEEGNTEDNLVELNTSLNEVSVQDDLLAKADKALRLKAKGNSVAKIAAIFGKTPNTIRNYLKIGSLPDDMKRAVKAGKVTVAAAVALAEKTLEERAALLAKIPESETSPEEQAEAEGDDGTDVPVDTGAPAKVFRKKTAIKVRKGPSAREVKGELTPKKFQKLVLETIEAFPKMDPQFRLGVEFALQLKPLDKLPRVLRDMFSNVQDAIEDLKKPE